MIPKDQLLHRMHGLPTMPECFFRLQRVLANDRSGAGDLEHVIKPDPALTANLLRVANSAYFGCPRKVTGIRHAIVLMGTRQVYEAAASASFALVIPGNLLGYGIRASEFWLHSMSVAMLSQRLARELKLDTSEQTYTAGLLHDIGKLVIGIFLADSAKEVIHHMRQGELSFVEAEREALGTDHAAVGATLAEHWRLPREVVDVVRHHHMPDEGCPQQAQRLVDLVHTADGLAHSLGFGSDLGELARRISSGAPERLGLAPGVLERIASETTDQIWEMAGIMDQTKQATAV